MPHRTRSDRPHYEVAISEDGAAWNVVDSRTHEVVRLNELPQVGLPETVALEIAALLNWIAKLPPDAWN